MHAFVLNQGREKSLIRRHPWIFSKAIAKALCLDAIKDYHLLRELSADKLALLEVPFRQEEQGLAKSKNKSQANLQIDAVALSVETLENTLTNTPAYPQVINQVSSSKQEQNPKTKTKYKAKHKIKAGELCLVLDNSFNFLCYAHYSPNSQIRLRAFSFEENVVINYSFIKERIKLAVDKRKVHEIRGDHGIRLIAAEGDYMPGLIVDRFNNVISFAFSSWGMESLYKEIVQVFHELFPDCYLYERSDSKSRLKEGLPLRSGLIDHNDINPQYNLKNAKGEAVTDSKQITKVQKLPKTIQEAEKLKNTNCTQNSSTINNTENDKAEYYKEKYDKEKYSKEEHSKEEYCKEEHNLISIDECIPDTLYVLERNLVEIPIDVKAGHKTGGYLDQRQSRYHTYTLCKELKALSEDGKTGPSVLNCFSYTGGFGLFALKGGAKAVYNIDVSAHALDAAKQGVVHNHLDPGRCKFIKEDVFNYLRKEVAKGTKFDIVILDPPKFAEGKSSLATACRGYQDINRLGMQLVRKGGHLLTFSCSGLMTEDLFQKIVADAALDANVKAQLVCTLRQDIDHVVALPCPESFYLKGLDVIIS